MVSISSLDAINLEENNPFKNVFVDVDYVKTWIDTLTNEELEKLVIHCITFNVK